VRWNHRSSEPARGIKNVPPHERVVNPLHLVGKEFLNLRGRSGGGIKKLPWNKILAVLLTRCQVGSSSRLLEQIPI
jgi:hypothetical protein